MLFRSPFEKILDFRHVHQYGKHILHQTLSNEISYRQVPGSVAELGVDFGDTAKYLNLYFPDRTLYLFDTFCGFDARDKDAVQGRTATLLEYYNTRSNAEDVLGRMFYPESCVVKEGYFPESLHELPDGSAWHGSARQRHHSGCLFRADQAGETCGHGRDRKSVV